MKAPRYLCAGSVGVDVIACATSAWPPDSDLLLAEYIGLHQGGCAANTALALAGLGCGVGLVGHIGADILGRFVFRELTEGGVDTTSVFRDKSHPTGCTVVFLSTERERTFVYSPGANILLRPDDIGPHLAGADFLHLSDTFLLPNLDGPPAVSLLARAQALGVVTSVDTAWDPQGRWLDILGPYLPHTSILFTGLNEARKLIPRTADRGICQALIEYGVKTVLLKMGSEGVLVATDSECTCVPAVPAEVVDTTGAGDCFNAGFLAAYGSGASTEEAAYVGATLAAATITEFGAATNVRTYEELVSLAWKSDDVG